MHVREIYLKRLIPGLENLLSLLRGTKLIKAKAATEDAGVPRSNVGKLGAGLLVHP